MKLYAGQVYSIDNKLILILCTKLEGSAYVVDLSNSGTLVKGSRVYFRHDLDKLDPKKLQFLFPMKLTSIEFKGKVYSWSRPNLEASLAICYDIDRQLSQLDQRFNLFLDSCTPEQLEFFNRNEDRNYHSENDDFVKTYCDFFIYQLLINKGGVK